MDDGCSLSAMADVPAFNDAGEAAAFVSLTLPLKRYEITLNRFWIPKSVCF